MREAAQRARRLDADLGVGVIGECRQPLPQGRFGQARGKLGEPRERRIVGATQSRLQMIDDDRPGAQEHCGVIGLHGRREPWQAIQRRQREVLVLHALERRDRGDVDGGMGIVDQARQPGDIARHRRHAHAVDRNHSRRQGALQARGGSGHPKLARPNGARVASEPQHRDTVARPRAQPWRA